MRSRRSLKVSHTRTSVPFGTLNELISFVHYDLTTNHPHPGLILEILKCGGRSPNVQKMWGQILHVRKMWRLSQVK